MSERMSDKSFQQCLPDAFGDFRGNDEGAEQLAREAVRARVAEAALTDERDGLQKRVAELESEITMLRLRCETLREGGGE